MKYLSALVPLVIVGLATAQVDNAKIAVATDPGMYVQNAGGGLTKIIGQIAQFTRTGSRLVSGATVGIKSAKVNIQLAGPHAQAVVSPQPTFYFIPPKQEAAAGVNAGDLILIRLEEKSQRGQFEIAAAGLFRASAGISLTHQIQILRSEPKPGVYMLMPATELNKGEYALYLARGEGMAAYVYDFGVLGTLSTSAVRVSRVHPEFNIPEHTAAVDDRESTAVALPAMTSTPVKSIAILSRGGVLGVSGVDWQQGGVNGVEVTEVSEESSAQIAGLRKGDVITDLNGIHVRSTLEMGHVLSQMEPGTRLSIGYLYKSNLGWMPKEGVAILGRE
jgi:hypothetical protein